MCSRRRRPPVALDPDLITPAEDVRVQHRAGARSVASQADVAELTEESVDEILSDHSWSKPAADVLERSCGYAPAIVDLAEFDRLVGELGGRYKAFERV